MKEFDLDMLDENVTQRAGFSLHRHFRHSDGRTTVPIRFATLLEYH